MALLLQATEQGKHPPPAAGDDDHPRQPAVRPPKSQKSLHCAAPSSPTGGGGGCHIPDDILLEILRRLPVKALSRFKCVSRAWLALAADCLRTAPPTLQGLFYRDAKGPNRRLGFFDLSGSWGSAAAPPVDPSFPFLPALPETDQTTLVDSCNGLLLLWRTGRPDPDAFRRATLGFIVCNPATREWAEVPPRSDVEKREISITRVIFDPAASSSRFELVQFLFEYPMDDAFQVHTY